MDKSECRRKEIDKVKEEERERESCREREIKEQNYEN